jgi:AraC-like DNA-binding protein
MGSGGSVLFTDVRAFEARIPGKARFVVVNGTPFRARLTWMELRGLLLVHAREAVQRVAYLSLPAGRTTACFPTDQKSLLVCDGTEISAGQIVLYRDGARTHQRTLGHTRWSLISLETSALRDIGMVLAGRNFTDSPGMILRSASADWRQLLKSHSEAVRIAETQLTHIDHPQVARALEQELTWALVNCLSTAEVIGHVPGIDQGNVLARFETCLVKQVEEPLPIADICKCLNVSERRLRSLCSRILGMSPLRYQRLRALAPGVGDTAPP